MDIASLSCSPTILLHNTTAIANMGASDHYFTNTAPVTNNDIMAPKTTILTATGERCTSVGTAQLNLDTIPTALARTGHIMPGFKNNLISIGKLCDANCTAYFNKNHIMVRDENGKLVLHGTREHNGAESKYHSCGSTA